MAPVMTTSRPTTMANWTLPGNSVNFAICAALTLLVLSTLANEHEGECRHVLRCVVLERGLDFDVLEITRRLQGSHQVRHRIYAQSPSIERDVVAVFAHGIEPDRVGLVHRVADHAQQR